MQIRLHFVVFTGVKHGSGLEQDIFDTVDRFVPRPVWNDLPDTLLLNFKNRNACETAIQVVARELDTQGRYYTETIVLVREEEWPSKPTS